MARSLQEIQNDINAALAASGGEWTPELNALVAERKAAEKEVKPSQTRTLTPAPAYSLGDVEYRASMDRYVKDDPLALLALNEIERLTGGDYGQVIKAVTQREAQTPVEKALIKDHAYLPGIYDTNLRGIYSPVTSPDNPTGLPQILVNTIDYIDQFGADYDKRNVPAKAPPPDDPSFFERLMRIIGVMDKPVPPKKSLSQLREEGSMPTAADMERLRRDQGTGLTTRHELDHLGFDVLRALGHSVQPENEDEGDHEHEHYTDALDEDSELGEKGLNYAELARQELIRRRGYAQGGIASIRKAA
jgi:hypothetical protein